MAEIIQFRKEDDKLYGQCPLCGCDEFHVLMDDDEDVRGNECKYCRAEYLFPEGEYIQFELEQ